MDQEATSVTPGEAPSDNASEDAAVAPPVRAGWHPLAWLVAGLIGLIVPHVVLQSFTNATGALGAILLSFVDVGFAFLVYRFLMRYLAKRPGKELAASRFATETLLGMALGAAFVGGSAGLVAAFSGYAFTWSPAAPLILLEVLAVNLGAAVVEELVFRGVAFLAIEELFGPLTALATTSLFFGAAHLGNPNATWWSAFAIACEAGLLLGAAFLWRRHLGFVVGLHFAWNSVEAWLGISVSGHASPGLFEAKLTGSQLLTGGSFGLEASVVPVIASLFLSVPMIVLARRRLDEAADT